MRRRTRASLLGVLAVAAVALGACSGGGDDLPPPNRAFCTAAYQYDRQIEKKLSLSKQIALVSTMADEAPRDIRAEAATFLNALEKLHDGDKSVIDDPDIAAAVEAVNRRATSGCGLYEQENNSGM